MKKTSYQDRKQINGYHLCMCDFELLTPKWVLFHCHAMSSEPENATGKSAWVLCHSLDKASRVSHFNWSPRSPPTDFEEKLKHISRLNCFKSQEYHGLLLIWAEVERFTFIIRNTEYWSLIMSYNQETHPKRFGKRIHKFNMFLFLY